MRLTRASCSSSVNLLCKSASVGVGDEVSLGELSDEISIGELSSLEPAAQSVILPLFLHLREGHGPP